MESSPLNDMRTTPPAPEERSSGSSALIATVVVIILLILGAWFVLSGRSMQTTVTYDDQGNEITHVEAGSVVSAFPSRFLVEEGAVVAESYTIDYENDDTLLSTARYMSTQDLASNINAFGAIFVTEGWLVTVEPNYEATGPTNFYAIKDNEQVNVVFVPINQPNAENGPRVEVVISHLIRG